MRKSCFLFIFSLAMCAMPVVAQHGKHAMDAVRRSDVQQGRPTQMMASTLRFTAAGHEDFSVFLDGEKVQSRNRRIVELRNVSPEPHIVVVVMDRPAEKAAAFVFVPDEPATSFLVAFDGRASRLDVFRQGPHGSVLVSGQMSIVEEEPVGVAQSDVPSPAEMADIIAQIEKESFENSRIEEVNYHLGLHWFTTAQIMSLARTLSFENNRITFFKKAYDVCVDPENYLRTIDMLSFESNRNDLKRFIRERQ